MTDLADQTGSSREKQREPTESNEELVLEATSLGMHRQGRITTQPQFQPGVSR